MNCERAERLLPLHAGGDLEDARERAALAAHLGDCEACRRLEAEWAESVSLLRLDEPPEFDAAFFDPIRRNVMREITATRPAPPALAALLAQLLRPKPLAYAASLALVCAALFFALRLPRAPQPSKSASDGVAASFNKQLSFENEMSKPTPPHVFVREGERRKTRASELPSRRERAASQPSADKQSHARTTTTTPRVNSIEPTPLPDQVASVSLPGAEPTVVKDAREMLKIDLQTGDPDVRIIWFSPQPNEQASPRRTTDKR